jgi:nucleoside-diphosphate-sugar epimerase
MNTVVPANVAQHFTKSRIVAFSSGNVYGWNSPTSGGSTEETELNPVGDYACSTLGRERTFQFYSRKNKTPTALIRLYYAIDMRYGVLFEVGSKVWKGEPLDVTVGHVNVIWQGDANAQTLLALEHCTVPANILNVTGPELIGLRPLAEQFGKLMGKTPVIVGKEGDKVLTCNTQKAARLFGYPSVTLQQMIEWTVHWIKNDGRSLNKPSHFEAKDGKY